MPPMATCIFCPSLIDADTHREHVLPDGLGGKMTTTRVVCSRCNNLFGRSIDKELVGQFEFVRNFLQLRSGSGSPPPAIRKVQTSIGVATLEQDGRLKFRAPPFKVVDLDDKSKQIQISAASLDQIERNIPHMAAALRISEERLRAEIINADVKSVIGSPGPVHVEMSFGGLDAMRAAAKSCLVLWTTLVGSDEVRSHLYDNVREYIKNGNAEFHSSKIRIDSRYVHNNDTLRQKFGEVFCLIYVKSNQSGCVIGYCTIYNLISFSVILCEAGGFRGRKIGVAFDPITGVWSPKIAPEIDIPFDWLATPDDGGSDFAVTRQRLSTILEIFTQRDRQREIDRIIEAVLGENKIDEGEKITEEWSQKISGIIASRVAHLLVGVPYERTIDKSELVRRLGGVNTSDKI